MSDIPSKLAAGSFLTLHVVELRALLRNCLEESSACEMFRFDRGWLMT